MSESKAEEIAAKSFNRIGMAVSLIENKKRSEEEDKSFLEVLSEKIISLYLKGAVKNSEVLKELLLRESVLHRYNLNQNLQQKAVEYLIS